MPLENRLRSLPPPPISSRQTWRLRRAIGGPRAAPSARRGLAATRRCFRRFCCRLRSASERNSDARSRDTREERDTSQSGRLHARLLAFVVSKPPLTFEAVAAPFLQCFTAAFWRRRRRLDSPRRSFQPRADWLRSRQHEALESPLAVCKRLFCAHARAAFSSTTHVALIRSPLTTALIGSSSSSVAEIRANKTARKTNAVRIFLLQLTAQVAFAALIRLWSAILITHARALFFWLSSASSAHVLAIQTLSPIDLKVFSRKSTLILNCFAVVLLANGAQ